MLNAASILLQRPAAANAVQFMLPVCVTSAVLLAATSSHGMHTPQVFLQNWRAKALKVGLVHQSAISVHDEETAFMAAARV
jgi:hypothetical protein